MRPLAWLCPAFLPFAIVGCARAPVPLPGIAQGDGRVEWHGTAPCADCAGIDTRLVLERDGQDRGYMLVETYVADAGDLRFVDHGQWRQEAALLQLRGDAGSRRTYEVRADGRLQSRDSHGRPLPLQDGALLSLVAP